MIAILFSILVASCCDTSAAESCPYGNITHPELMIRSSNFVNSGISINYVKNWGLKEGLRELMQNMLDGMVSYIIDENGSKSQLETNIIQHSEPWHREYEFIWNNPKNKLKYKIGNITI
eukprot:UN12487